MKSWDSLLLYARFLWFKTLVELLIGAFDYLDFVGGLVVGGAVDDDDDDDVV